VPLPALDDGRFRGSWARHPLAQTIRNGFICYVLGPLVRYYTDPRVLGRENLAELRAPVVFAANHSSHLDTPLILQSLPPEWRRRTAVVAAADYFYRNALVASLVSLAFGTVPIERNVATSRGTAQRLNDVVGERWNLLLYPEGTRSRDGRMGKLRSGAARVAVDHGIPLVPISVLGSHAAMPPGRAWPRRHPVVVRFGSPIAPQRGEDHRTVTEKLQAALEEMGARTHP
jgi:1-acyl-sn-glycerol-3-phosphate acyltransferase